MFDPIVRLRRRYRLDQATFHSKHKVTPYR